jgi:hypothetical protein
MIEVPSLKIDRDGDGPDTLVCLQQEGMALAGEQVVYLHPTQIRLLAERMGLLAPGSNIDADRTIARLCRQIRTLANRIEYLDDWLHTCSDTAHADLDYEQTYSQATWEIALEFVKDLPAANASSMLQASHGTLPEAAAASARKASAPVANKARTEGGQGLPLFAEGGQQ